MNEAVAQWQKVMARIGGRAKLVAVSKTFSAPEIEPVIAAGQRIFGENRVQEAMAKWPALRLTQAPIELHLIGPLQSNKVGEAVSAFDVIQTVDRDKIAKALANEMSKKGKLLRCFVQVNTGGEPQKSGIMPEEVDALVTACRQSYQLDIVGLMAIPPAEADPRPHFRALAQMAARNGLDQLSMGMSGDFEQAIVEGATHVRVGSAIFGSRPQITR